MLGQARPQGSLGPFIQSMCPDTHHTGTPPGIGPILAGFEEEVDASLRPIHFAGAAVERALSPKIALKLVEKGVKPDYVVQSGHGLLPSPSQRNCSPIRRPSIGTSIVAPHSRSSIDRNSRYLSPARNTKCVGGVNRSRIWRYTSCAQARRSATPISFSVVL